MAFSLRSALTWVCIERMVSKFRFPFVGRAGTPSTDQVPDSGAVRVALTNGVIARLPDAFLSFVAPILFPGARNPFPLCSPRSPEASLVTREYMLLLPQSKPWMLDVPLELGQLPDCPSDAAVVDRERDRLV